MGRGRSSQNKKKAAVGGGGGHVRTMLTMTPPPPRFPFCFFRVCTVRVFGEDQLTPEVVS